MLSNSSKPSPSGGNYWPVGQKEQLLEVLVFLFLIVPSMVLSFFIIRRGSLGFVFTAFSVILRDLALVSLILFFLWRNGEPLEGLGWNLPFFRLVSPSERGATSPNRIGVFLFRRRNHTFAFLVKNQVKTLLTAISPRFTTRRLMC